MQRRNFACNGGSTFQVLAESPISKTSDVKYATGAVLSVTEESEGQYSVEQLEIQSSTGNKAPAGLDAVIPIHWSFGPISIDGYINTSTFEIRVTVKIVGITIGTFVGNLKDGVSIKHLERGSEVMTCVPHGTDCFHLIGVDKEGRIMWCAIDPVQEPSGVFAIDETVVETRDLRLFMQRVTPGGALGVTI
ncbi:hypothetical protein LTR70_002450 [Exophiala xenobiotica]|uniref:Uncharacterized protein n=1 Tax=Lithohypha guttulata TaxID=1690604 RepID=A0ABR0KKY9_9EURO|nr:hypothetical protein LTR24_001447 [Lithohypha guttulata]KAK5325478.1 hypothetical protein LTR70_002450 [Exophiala xenobiotica]